MYALMGRWLGVAYLVFAARDYAKGEHLAVYMGEDMGRSDMAESLEAQERLAAVKRADHVMEIAGREVCGRA